MAFFTINAEQQTKVYLTAPLGWTLRLLFFSDTNNVEMNVLIQPP